MKRHLPYGITQRYLPHDTGERALPLSEPGMPVFDLHTPDGQKAELMWKLYLCVVRFVLCVCVVSVLSKMSLLLLLCVCCEVLMAL